MRIQCPACAATYEVPANLLKPGLTVRCARCANEWVPPAEADESPPLATPVPTPESRPEPEVRAQPRPVARTAPRKAPAAPPAPGARALRAAWIASVVVLAALLWGAFSQRDAVMKAWPPSIRVYAALGLADRR